MDLVIDVVGIVVFFGVVIGARTYFPVWLIGLVAARLPLKWRFLALPLASAICFGLFMVLRPFVIVDQPRTPLWWVIAVLAFGLLFAGAVLAAYTVIQAGRYVFSGFGATRSQRVFGFVVMGIVALLMASCAVVVVTHLPAIPSF